jgi:uncharacterized protein (TIGR03437 family)
MSRLNLTKLPLAVLALAICTGSLHAAAGLTLSPAAIALTCDTVLGPTPYPVLVTLVTGSSGNITTTKAAGTAAVGAVTLPGVAAASATVPFVFSMAAGCANAAVGSSNISITMTPATLGANTAVTVLATLTVTNSSGSALAPSPAAVTLLCTKSGSTYTAGSAVTENVTSPAYLGTPFTVSTNGVTTNGAVETALPGWLTVTGAGTASSTQVPLTITPVGGSAGTGCSALPVGTTTYNLHLLNVPAPDKIIPITIEVGLVNTTTTVAPATTSLSYTKGSLNYVAGTANVINSTPASFFTVDPSTLPLWLNVNNTSGTAPVSGGSMSVAFIPTVGAETLALGTYTANVHLKFSGELDTVIPVTLLVKNLTASLSVAEGITRNINWTLGTPLPTLVITPVSTDSAIDYAITTNPETLSPQLTATTGIAYSFGSAPIPVTFTQAVFGAAAPGTTLTGTVTFTPTTGTAVTVTINVLVKSPGAVITSISPTALPTATSGSFTVVLSGSGFVSTGVNLVTKAGIVSSGSIVSDYFVVPTVINSTTISLAITVPSSNDPYLPFSGVGGAVTFGVCNPGGGNCSTPASTIVLTLGVNPIVQAVTSASSFMQASAPTLTPVSAYDILSIFGTDFCVSGGTGCMASSNNAILYGVTDPVTSRYLTTLTPDSTGTIRNLSVTFQTHASTPVSIGTAPLLFATNNQINLVVPSAVATYIGSTVDIVVNFGSGLLTAATMNHSAPFSVTIAASDPGLFAVGGSGQGAAAALSASYVLNSTTAPAIARATTPSDYIQLYVTGLGVPDAVTATPAWTQVGSVTCMTAASYWAAVNTTDAPTVPLTSNDGLVLQSALLPNSPPCIQGTDVAAPTVTIGGINAPVAYAGWVSGSIAGLYQINAQIPVRTSSFIDVNANVAPTTTTQLTLPVVVTTAAGITSQPSGVSVIVVGGLLMTPSVTPPPTTGHSGAAATWALTNASGHTVYQVTASDGTGAETYAYTLNGADTTTLGDIGLLLTSGGFITGTAVVGPNAGVATVTVIATGNTSGIVGTLQITITIT